MMQHIALIGLLLALPSSAFAASPVALYRIGSALTVEGAGDTHVVGKIVRVHELEGDAMVLARELIVQGAIHGDLDAFAERLSVIGSVEDDAHIVSSDIAIQGSVGGHLLAAGKNISVASGATIGDVSTVIGRTVELRGHFERLVYILGDSVTLAGTYDGDVVVIARSVLTVDPTTTIHGTLRFSVRPGAAVHIPETLRTQGKLVSSEEWSRFFFGVPLPRVRLSPFLSLWVLGAFFILLWPRAAQKFHGRIRARPLRHLGAGILFGFCVCTLALLAFLPFLMLTILLLLALFLSFCVAASLAPLLLASMRPSGHRASLLFAYTVWSALLFVLFVLLPWLATVLFFFLTLISLGALLRLFPIGDH